MQIKRKVKVKVHRVAIAKLNLIEIWIIDRDNSPHSYNAV